MMYHNIKGMNFQSIVSTEAFVAEKNSLMNLKFLVDRSIEMLCLWQVLCEHNFEDVVLHLEAVSCCICIDRMVFLKQIPTD